MNVVVDKLRVDRTRVRLAEVSVGDETGTVSLRARDDQIDVLQDVSKRGGAVVLRNCTLELFQGKHIRLAVTKWGKLSMYPDNVASTPPPPSTMNRERNFSLIDLSLVASEMVENQPPDSNYQSTAQRDPNVERSRQSTPRTQYQQIQYNPQRKSGRDRRQARAKPNPMNPVGVYPDVTMGGQMRYPAIQSYSIYGEGLGSPAYGYNPSTQLRPPPEQMHPSAQQQILQLQQYEMQQRQLQHMHAYHEHQERQRQLGRSIPHLLPGVLGPSGSFETSDYSSLQSSGSPLLVPIRGVRGQHDTYGNVVPNLGASADTGRQYPHETPERLMGRPQGGGRSDTEPLPTPTREPEGAWRRPVSFEQHHRMDESTMMSSGRMNPQATVFAPSYGDASGELCTNTSVSVL